MVAAASFRLTIDKPSLLRYTAVQAVIELCRAARRTALGDKVRETLDPARPIDLTAKFDQDFVSAFLEVLNNVVLHAYQLAEAQIEVLGQFTATEVRVDLCHFGLGFDMRQIAEPDLASLPEGGMGLFIAKSLLDELRYEPGQYDADAAPQDLAHDVPNRWILTKRLPAAQAMEGPP